MRCNRLFPSLQIREGSVRMRIILTELELLWYDMAIRTHYIHSRLFCLYLITVGINLTPCIHLSLKGEGEEKEEGLTPLLNTLL